MYLKKTLGSKDIKLELIINGVIETPKNGLELYFKAPIGVAIDDVREMFENISDVTIYTDDPHDKIHNDGTVETLTDERVHSQYDKYTSLNKIEYDYFNNVYRVILNAPSETEQRVAELEDALNFLLMGGEE